MQTLLAFAFEQEVSPERIRAGLSRIERWYGSLWGTRPDVRHQLSGRLGLHQWQHPEIECRWPAWATCGPRAVASLHVPLGYPQLVGDAGLATAPVALVRRLLASPTEVMRLTAPFVLASLDSASGTLSLHTDGLGLGRLYELRTSEGRCWSNRPVATLLFAGVRAEADPLAWLRMAACDWPMGDATPYLGVRAVGAATTIRVDRTGHRETSLDVLSLLGAPPATPLQAGRRSGPLAPESLEQTAAALTDRARAIGSLWPGVPVLSLSGGRDSRLVAAAFLAAGVEVTLKTYGAASGEADTARLLVERLPRPVRHRVTDAADASSTAGRGRRSGGALARAGRWHDLTEGLRPAVYLRRPPPSRLSHHRPILVCGVGGEFGHAPGYPDDVESIEQLALPRRLDAFARALQAKVVLPRGLAEDSVREATAQIRNVLAHAAARGVSDAKALDWFYADERLRRWGMAGESTGRVLPLLLPEFVSAAFGLTTAQSIGSDLHTALIERLVPQWAGIPYYSASLADRSAVRSRRLADADDVDLLSGVIADPHDWGDAFDVPRVQAIWRRARIGRAGARDELLLQRVIWRVAFADHLARVNGDPVPLRREVASTVRASRIDLSAAVRVLATRANDVSWARGLARTAAGRRLRRALGV